MSVTSATRTPPVQLHGRTTIESGLTRQVMEDRAVPGRPAEVLARPGGADAAVRAEAVEDGRALPHLRRGLNGQRFRTGDIEVTRDIARDLDHRRFAVLRVEEGP